MSDELEKLLYGDLPDEVIPKFCPNCGAEFVRVSKDGLIWVMPVGEQKDAASKFKVTDFDVYCDNCEWSGYISSDALDMLEDLSK